MCVCSYVIHPLWCPDILHFRFLLTHKRSSLGVGQAWASHDCFGFDAGQGFDDSWHVSSPWSPIRRGFSSAGKSESSVAAVAVDMAGGMVGWPIAAFHRA